MRIFTKKIATALLGIVSVSSFATGLSACSSCKSKTPAVEEPDNNTTIRYEVPDDNSTPSAYTVEQNIGFLATVLDNQQYYHVYAHNSTKALGYEQITQTWKDYKSADLTGVKGGVMVCSDLTYSTFVKAGTQTCFVGGTEAYMRTSSKPGKNTTSTTAKWSTDAPTYYDKESYLTKYGDFSTELSVYVINSTTIESSESVTLNSDGTYSMTLYLNEGSACYYQYGMKTRGGLKSYPEYESIKMTFTFDSKWRVLETVCEEETKISPSALGGITTDSKAKTTTTFSYEDSDFDEVHFNYYETYYKNYVGHISAPSTDESIEEPDVMSVLGNSFSEVINPEGNGQEFNTTLTVGDTSYDGAIHLQIGDISDALNTIDARISLGKQGSGKQDLYVEYSDGTLNAYYSDNFALTANIDSVSTALSQFSAWLAKLNSTESVSTYALLSDSSVDSDTVSEIAISALLNSLNFNYTDTTATISLKTDSLLGTGIGADVTLNFARVIDTDGTSAYTFVNADIKNLSVNGESVQFAIAITPKTDSTTISHVASDTTANLADYITSVYNILNSNTVAVNFTLDGNAENISSYLSGLKAEVTAYVDIESDLASKADISLTYKGVNLSLEVCYTTNIHSAEYGRAYITLKSFNGKSLNAKVYSNISDTVEAVEALIQLVNGTGATNSDAQVATLSAEESESIANTINNILNIDYSSIIGEVYVSNSQLKVLVDVDELLSALEELGVVDAESLPAFGQAGLTLTMGDNNTSKFALSLPAIGLTVGIEGSDNVVTVPTDGGYLDITTIVDLATSTVTNVQDIISSNGVTFAVNGSVTVDGVPMTATGSGEVSWENGLTVALDVTLSVAKDVTADKDNISIKLIYNSNAGESEPIVRLAINSLALSLTRDDVAEIEKLIEAIEDLTDRDGDIDEDTAVDMGSQDSVNISVDFDALKDLLTDSELQSALSSALELVGNLSVSLKDVDNTNVYTLFVSYLSTEVLTFTADDGIALSLSGTNYSLSGAVSAYNGELTASVSSAIGNLSEISKESFVKTLYYYAFATLENLTVGNVLGSDTYQVTVTLNGDNSNITDLEGIIVTATLAYAENEARKLVSANVDFSFVADVNGDETVIGANVTVNYSDEYIYLSINSVNYGGKVYKLSLKAKASIYDIYDTAEYIVKLVASNMVATDALDEDAEVETDESVEINLSSIIANILDLDFEKLVSVVKVDGGKQVVIDIDELVSAFDVENVNIGTLSATLNSSAHSIDANVAVEGNEAWLTFNAGVVEGNILDNFNSDGYLDLSIIADLVINAGNTVHNIFDENGTNDVTFNIDTTLTVNGLSLGVEGVGEVSWKDGLQIAVDASAYYANGTSASKNDYFTIKFVYDETATVYQPLIRLAVNSVGLNIYRSDIQDTKDIITKLENTINALIGDNATEDNSENVDLIMALDLEGESFEVGDSKDVLKLIVTNSNIQKALSVVVKVLGEFSVTSSQETLDSATVNSLVLALGSVGQLSLESSDNGTLSANFNTYINDVQVTGTTAGISTAYNFALGATLVEELEGEGYTIFDSQVAKDKLIETFSKVVFDFMYASVAEISDDEFIGSSTYEVTLSIDGSKSGIQSLEDVYVDAGLYYTPGLVGAEKAVKLVEADLDMMIKGTAVKLNARYAGEKLYVSIERVGNTDVDVKLSIGIHDIYSGVEGIVSILTNDSIIKVINDFRSALTSTVTITPNTSDEEVQIMALSLEDEEEESVESLLYQLLTFDFKSMFSFNKVTVDNVTTYVASVNTDELMELLGLEAIGTFNAGIKIVDASSLEEVVYTGIATSSLSTAIDSAMPSELYIYANLEKNGVEWAKLETAKAPQRQYEADWQSSYIDIGFIATLVNDLENSLTNDNGEIYELYTFAGNATFTVSLSVGSIKLNAVKVSVDIMSFTFGIKDGQIYATALIDLPNVSAMGYTLVSKRTVSITLSVYNGTPYITLGRDVESDSEIYKVMTLAYFVDNMFDESNSPIRWLLGTSDTLWKALASTLKSSINLDSGLTTPDEITLYSESNISAISEEETSSFSLATIFNSFAIKTNGTVVTEYSNGSVDSGAAASQLGISDNDSYYAFAFNTDSISAVSGLYAALLREKDENGNYYINGFTAKGSVASVIEFNVALTDYLEGVDYCYGDTPYVETLLSNESAMYSYNECEGLTEFAEGVTYYVSDTDGNYVENTEEFSEDTTYYTYTFTNTTYYVLSEGEYVLATAFNADDTYYVYRSTELGKAAGRNYLTYVLANYTDSDGNAIDLDKGGEYDAENHYTQIFGGYDTSSGYLYSNELDKISVTVYNPDGSILYDNDVKYGSTINLLPESSLVLESGMTNVYLYELNGETRVGASIVVDENTMKDGKIVLTLKAYSVVTVELENTIEGGVSTEVTGIVGDTITCDDVVNLSGGWYSDSELTQKVEVFTAGVTTLYAKLASATYLDNFKVEYTFVANADGTDGTYAVSNYYGTSDYIYIANEVAGFKVTAILDEAFKTTKEGYTGATLANVVVPENITTVGKNAFTNNYGIKTVTFLAESVTFEGASKSDKNGAFYGCTDTDGGTTTSLVIYYNTVTNSGTDWTHVRRTSSWGKTTDYNATAYGANAWANVNYYVDGEIEFTSGDVGLDEGYVTSALTADEIVAKIENYYNSKTYKDGYINGYSATVSNGYTLDGQFHTITVSVTENSTKYYLVSNSDANITVTAENSVSYNEGKYVLEGTTVTLTPDAKHTFATVSIEGGEQAEDVSVFTFTMPASVATVKATLKSSIEGIAIVSAVDATYNGEAITANQAYTYTPAGTTLSAITAEGYIFAGWAYVDGTTNELTFCSGEIELGTYYYAVWVVERSGLTSVVPATEGTALSVENATCDGDVVNGLAGWYTDESFATAVENISVENTVLVPRFNYSVSVTFTGSSAKISASGEKTLSETTTEFTLDYVVLENADIEIKFTSYLTGNKCAISYNGTTTTIQGTSGSGLSTKYKKFTLTKVGDEEVSVTTGSNKTITVQQNLTITGTYS
jgi:hypothetical protein